MPSRIPQTGITLSLAEKEPYSCHPITKLVVDEDDEEYQQQHQPPRKNTRFCRSNFKSLPTATLQYVKSSAKSEANIHYSPLNHRARDLTKENIQTGRAQFAFSKSVLVVPSLQSSVWYSLLLQHGVFNSARL